MTQEKLQSIGLSDLGNFGIGETTGALYFNGERLCTAKELAALNAKLEELADHPAFCSLRMPSFKKATPKTPSP
ncbi:MAG: hypothetical protein WCD70_15865 [Alphaproteobacteria bacterium]